MPEKRIIVKYDALHPYVQIDVNSILRGRKGRISLPIKAALYSLPLIPLYSILPFFMLKEKPLRQRLAASVQAPFAYLKEYKKAYVESSIVTPFRMTKLKKGIQKVGFIDKEKKINVKKIRKTHPFAFVNRKGDVILVPKTRFQEALYRAQLTFLKHILPTPGRYRIEL